METDRRDCSYQGHLYRHGARVRIEGKCMVCKNGHWEFTASEDRCDDAG
ncbi:MAG: hypothetical protein ACLGPL_00670 [Acidobacteriota bacterium]